MLISESFYNFFEYKEKDKESLNIEINKILEIINELIEYLINMGTQVYVPLIPKHFLYSDSINSSFLDSESKDIFIQKINHKLYDKFNHLPSITFLIGIEDLNWEISKEYFRFSSKLEFANC